MNKIAILGSGSWGTALGQHLSGKGYEVRLWDLDKSLLAEMREKRENMRYLPGVKFHDSISIAETNEEAIRGADCVIFGIPAQHFRSGIEAALPYITPDMMIVNVAKGIEQKSLKRMSEIAFEEMESFGGGHTPEQYVVLSGPSHAEEVGLGTIPTTVTVASKSEETAKKAQELFSSDFFRCYTDSDIIGVELGGSLKNIIALGAGISDGLGFGDNTKAALMTRGIAEMSRLGAALGADIHTFAGLSGIGDLIVTCTSMHSRNRRCGIMIGEGVKPSEAVKRVGMVVEGIYTAEAAYELSKRAGVEMPLTEMTYRIINEEVDASAVAKILMNRPTKAEKEGK